jgi:hypothetical protein
MNPKTLCRTFVLLLLSAASALAQVPVPDSPAGHTLHAWLDAFDSGQARKASK